MKLIIEMPEKVVTAIQNGEDYRYDIHTAIAQGVPYEERPQGEWIRQPPSKTIFFCSNCGREINTSPFTRTDNFPFCHCGADMRGDKE